MAVLSRTAVADACRHLDSWFAFQQRQLAGGAALSGERLIYSFAADGTVESVRGGSATTAYPLEQMRAKVSGAARVTLGGGLRD